VRLHAKAPSAGSTPALGMFSSPLRANGSGAPSPRPLAPFALAALLALALPALASAAPEHPFLENFGSAAHPSFGEACGIPTNCTSSASGRPHSSHPEALRSTSRVRGRK